MNIEAINREVEAGFISVQQHPTRNLRIFNYTQRAQWENHWTPETRMCRGLILDGDNNIVARPFPKFFNLDQLESVGDTLPVEPFEVFEKLDGSLGILYYGDGWQIATRGSFISEQAKLGQQMFDKVIAGQVNREITLLFEIIHPNNRIVVDYGRRAELVLLAGVFNRTGNEVPYEFLQTMGYPVAKRFDGITDISAITAMHEDNAEGFVIRFASGYRVKVKFEEYKRLHKLLTGVTPRYIWDILRNGQSLDPLFERTPDEFHTWARSVIAKLQSDFAEIEAQAKAEFKSDFPTRKDAAEYIKTTKHPSILFSMLDGKPYADTIWKLIRPVAAVAFRCDEI